MAGRAREERREGEPKVVVVAALAVPVPERVKNGARTSRRQSSSRDRSPADGLDRRNRAALYGHSPSNSEAMANPVPRFGEAIRLAGTDGRARDFACPPG